MIHRDSKWPPWAVAIYNAWLVGTIGLFCIIVGCAEELWARLKGRL